MSVSRTGLKKIAQNLGLAQSAILDRFGDVSKNPAVMIELEAIMCRLRGSTLFYNDDYSKMYYPISNEFNFVKFPSNDIIGLGIQGANFSLDNTAAGIGYTGVGVGSHWNPGYYGPPCPEGFGVWDYNAWAFYNIDKPALNPSETSYTLRLDYKFPVRNLSSSTTYVIVPFFEHARYISIKNTSTTAGYDDAIWQFTLTSEQIYGYKLKDHQTDLPLDIRFMYAPKLIQGYSSGWEYVDVNHTSNTELKYLAHTISDNNDGTYTVEINIPNDLLYSPHVGSSQSNHVANKYWHIVMFWGTIDEEAFKNVVTFRTLKSDNVTPIPLRVASDYKVWPVKHFFRKDIQTKIKWEPNSINELGTKNLTGANRQYLIANGRQHFIFEDKEIYGSYSNPSVPSKYSLPNTLIDDSSLNSISNTATSLAEDQYQCALFVGKTSGESDINNVVEYLLVLGPEFYSDFARPDWENFEYYPPVPQDYTELAKLIFKRAPGESYGGLEYTSDNGSQVYDPFNTTTQITILQNSVIHWYRQSVVSHAVVPLADRLLASRLMPGFYTFLKQIRLDKGEDPTVSSGAKLMPYSAQIPTSIVNTRSALSIATDQGSIIFRKLLKRPYADNLQPETNEPLAIQFEPEGIKLIESIASLPPSTEMVRLNADYLFITNKKINIPTTFEIFHEPSDNCTAADASTSGSKTGLDYTFRLYLEDSNENVLVKDWRINASKYFLTVNEYNTRIAQEQTVVGYYTKDNLNTIDEWRLQGYAGVVPDLVMGELRVLNTRYVSPPDDTQQTEDQFRANLAAQGLTQEQIDERVLQYLETGGTFYTIDLNKYNNEFVTVRDASLAITTFTMDTIPWFNDNLVDFHKVQETEPDPILYSTLYADSFTIGVEGISIGALEEYDRLASAYYDQSFDVGALASDMNLEWNKYGFKFNSGSGGSFTDIGLYLKTNLFVLADTTLSNSGQITLKIYDNNSGVPGNLLSTSSDSVSYANLLETYAQYRWSISGNLLSDTEYWVILELSSTPQGGDIALASINPYTDFTYQELDSEAFSFVSLIDTNSVVFSIPLKVVLNSDNLTGALTNASGQVNINIYSDNNGSLGDKLFTADNVDFADLTEEFNNYSFTASDISVTFTKDTKYWVVITESVRTRGGVINSDLNSITIDPIKFRLEDTGRYTIWDDNNKKVWMILFNDFPEVYGVFNRENSGIFKWLPGPNLSRQTSQLYQKEGYWSFAVKNFTEPSYVYIYPRAVGVVDAIPPNADSELDFAIPPANWVYVPYQRDIYVYVRLICGGKLTDYLIHLDPTATPEPYLINADQKAESIAYVYVAKTLEELQNGTHGAPAGDRLVIRSS